jgi:hypothetical protein
MSVNAMAVPNGTRQSPSQPSRPYATVALVPTSRVPPPVRPDAPVASDAPMSLTGTLGR